MIRKNILLLGVLPLAIALVIPWWSAAQGPGKTTPQELDKQVVRTWAKKRTRAAAINFNKSLNLPWPSLHSLGGRIDAARQSGDPVAMGHLASELNVGEKVSGKKAALTSSGLFNEAAEQAKLRRDPGEVNALQHVARQIQADKNLNTALQKILQKAKQYSKTQEHFSVPSPLGPLNVHPVFIENYTEEPISIFMNGKYRLTVRPLKKQFLNIVNQPAPVVLHGYSAEHYWGPRNIYETIKMYRWILLPEKQSGDS